MAINPIAVEMFQSAVGPTDILTLPLLKPSCGICTVWWGGCDPGQQAGKQAVWLQRKKGSERWLRELGHTRSTRFGEEGSELCMSVSLLPYCGLAGWDRLSGWQACHGPVSALSHTIVAVRDWWGAATGWIRAAWKTGRGKLGGREFKLQVEMWGNITLEMRGFVRLC